MKETQVYSAFKDMYDEAFRAEEASLKAANGRGIFHLFNRV